MSDLSGMPRLFETKESTVMVIIVDADMEKMVLDITLHAPGNISNEDIARVLRDSADNLLAGNHQTFDMREVEDP